MAHGLNILGIYTREGTARATSSIRIFIHAVFEIHPRLVDNGTSREYTKVKSNTLSKNVRSISDRNVLLQVFVLFFMV